MAVFAQFIHRPQRVFIRQVNFQLHLWAGLLLSLYLMAVGITGSLLVFRAELETMSGLNPWHSLVTAEPYAKLETVADHVRAAYPDAKLISILAPTENQPTYIATIQAGGRDRSQVRIALHPNTGSILGAYPPNDGWLSVVERLHVNLLLGRRGRQMNAIGGALLMLLNVTGLVIWWPGIRSWTRALKVDFERTWRRVNFDLHRAVGFWTLAIVSLWATSGFYFAFSSQVFRFINRISPIVAAKPPVVTVPSEIQSQDMDLDRVIARARSVDPGTSLKGIAYPYSRRSPLLVFMNRRPADGYDFADTLFFNPYNGDYLAVWHYGVNQSLGDWLIWLEVPLHFGRQFGMAVKILWALLGLAIPLLTVTGALMYWNRVLRRKWKHLTHGGADSGARAVVLRN